MGRSPRVGIGVGSTGAEYPYPGVLGLVDAVEGPGRGAARTDGDAPGKGCCCEVAVGAAKESIRRKRGEARSAADKSRLVMLRAESYESQL